MNDSQRRSATRTDNPSAWSEADFGIGRLFGVMPDAVIVGEASSGRIVLWNPAAAAMFGYGVEDGRGLMIEHLVPDALKAAHREGLARLASAQPTPLLDSESAVELPAIRGDGTEIWIELRLAHISGPTRGAFALAIIRDITGRREIEAAKDAALSDLKTARDELEQRNRELDMLARTDYLTGLWNRRHVDEHLAMAVSAARRHNRPLSLLLLDIDEFKSINSRFGHQIGDRALQEVAARLKSHVRTEDTVGRWGGEEFLVILPDTDTSVAATAAERLRASIGDELVTCGNDDLELTVSIGIAGDDPLSQDELLTGADGALARAKAAGRNRCSL